MYPLLAKAESSKPPLGNGRLPVKEVTVFKDGHALVVQEGTMAVEGTGEVVLDEVPAPLMGSFGAYSADQSVKIASVTSGQKIESIARSALSIRELIEANPNANAVITEINQTHYDATILGLLSRSSEELAATSEPNAKPQLPQKSDLVLLKTAHGTIAMPLAQIQTITFLDEPKRKASQEEFRHFLRLKLDGIKPNAKTANVGLIYLQKGIRWIPNYRVDIDGQSNATVKLQATLINDMIDLTNATVNLVIGVPSFALKDTIDPIGLPSAISELSQYFQAQPNLGSGAKSVMASQIMYNVRQADSNVHQSPDAAYQSNEQAELPAGAKNEDLYVFTLHNISLRKGERMVLSITEATVPYSDVFVLNIPFAPPSDLNRNLNSQQQMEIARAVNAPKVMHKIRLLNKNNHPFTTAPALVFRSSKLISQSLMTYASPGATADLSLTTAIDIQVKTDSVETKRTPNALVYDGNRYFQVDLKGQIRITNQRNKPTEIEIHRYVVGQADSADHDGKIEMADFFGDREYLPLGSQEEMIPFWTWYNWPWWWSRVNGAGHITWKVKLDPAQTAELGYTWHYYWL